MMVAPIANCHSPLLFVSFRFVVAGDVVGVAII